MGEGIAKSLAEEDDDIFRDAQKFTAVVSDNRKKEGSTGSFGAAIFHNNLAGTVFGSIV
jgi:hypothetical protein